MMEHYKNYEEYQNRKPNSIKKTINGNKLVSLKDGMVGGDVVVPAHIYDMLKKRINELEKIINNAITRR